MASEKEKELQYIVNAVKTSLKTGDGCQICATNCDYADIMSILLANGWKQTGMKNPKKRKARDVLAQYEKEGILNYKIFYNVENPKQLVILGENSVKKIISIMPKSK